MHNVQYYSPRYTFFYVEYVHQAFYGITKKHNHDVNMFILKKKLSKLSGEFNYLLINASFVSIQSTTN